MTPEERIKELTESLKRLEARATEMVYKHDPNNKPDDYAEIYNARITLGLRSWESNYKDTL